MNEALQGKRRHKLLPAEVRAALPPLYTNEGKHDDPKQAVAHVKFFCPYSGRMTLYVTEFDGDDTLYGWMVSPLGPDCDEWGYSSFRELVEMNRNGLPLIERDCYWDARPVAEALRG